MRPELLLPVLRPVLLPVLRPVLLFARLLVPLARLLVRLLVPGRAFELVVPFRELALFARDEALLAPLFARDEPLLARVLPDRDELLAPVLPDRDEPLLAPVFADRDDEPLLAPLLADRDEPLFAPLFADRDELPLERLVEREEVVPLDRLAPPELPLARRVPPELEAEPVRAELLRAREAVPDSLLRSRPSSSSLSLLISFFATLTAAGTATPSAAPATIFFFDTPSS